MPDKRLITFQNRASLQLGIDPAFEEAALDDRAQRQLLVFPGGASGRTIEQPARHLRNLETSQSEFWNCPGGAQ
jgi:hypothetical protein